MKTEFAQILREKMMNSPSERADFSSGHAKKISNQTANSPLQSHDFPSHLAYLMGQIPKRNVANTSVTAGNLYSKMAKDMPVEKVNPHTLEGRFLQAFYFFSQEGEALSEAFSRKELKAKFRKLALKLHPDHLGSARLFMELREAFRCLMSLSTLK